MGLDLIVEARAKAGHEAEWREIARCVVEGDEPTEQQTARFGEISIPPYEEVGAPRVGHDPEADAWLINVRKIEAPDEVAAALKEFHGYHVLALVKSDGVPAYSNGGMYDGVDETSFRGAVLGACEAVLTKLLIEKAWHSKWPEAAAEYGRELLAAAKAASPPAGPPKRGLLARLGLGGKAQQELSFAEQVEAVEAAGRWFVFWGERGHPIRAWY